MKIRFSILTALYKKEMTDILRDRKTLLMMILLPVVLYPLLFFGGMYFVSYTLSGSGTQYVIACDSYETVSVLEEYLAYYDTYDVKIVQVKEGTDFSSVKADAEICISDDNYRIYYDSSVTASATAASISEELLEEYMEDRTRLLLSENGLDAEEILAPFSYEKTDTASSEDRIGYVLGMIMPFLLIVSIMMGALYPAIDVTAGEKERGTLETLLTLPVSNMELLSGKFLAVSTISVCSALLNILSMASACALWYASMNVSMGEDTNLWTFLPVFGIMLVSMLFFAVLISALLLCICVNTSSFKEAQNMTTPLLIIVLVFSMAGMLDGLKLSRMAAVPVVNVALLIRDAFAFQYSAGSIVTVLVSNLVYSAAVLVIMSRMYASESILFWDGMNGIHFFKSRKYIIKKEGSLPGVGDAVILSGVFLMLMLTVGTYLQVRFVGIGLLGIQALAAGLPLFMAWYMKNDFKELFAFRKPKKPAITIPACFLLWLGVYLFLISVAPVLEHLFPAAAENLDTTEDYIVSMSKFTMVMVVAVAPAVCEELFFRGFLLGTFRGKWSKPVALVLVSVLFGLYHMSLPKFFTTGLLGAANGFALLMSGSIYPAMAMHFLNNTISVLPYLFGDGCADNPVLQILNGVFPSPGARIITGTFGIILAGCGCFMFLLVGRKSKQAEEKS